MVIILCTREFLIIWRFNLDCQPDKTITPDLVLQGWIRRIPSNSQIAKLQKSLSLAESPETLLELGNTERALSDSYLATNQPELADKYAQNAIALHRAQQELLNYPNSQAPYYWSPYVLVGNWR